MGIIIDIVIITIIILSAFLGYKKGLVKLGTRLFAGIIAIILTIILYRPLGGLIINNTSIDEKIENTITENTTSFINENTQGIDIITNQIKNEILPEEAKNISQNVIYTITSILLFIIIKITLSIIIALLDFVADLPILKQFNEVGGIIYGLIRGIIIVCIFIFIIGAYLKINPQSTLNNSIDDTYLTNFIYKTIVRL